MPKVQISQRKLKKLLLAEKVCKELRYQITRPVIDGMDWTPIFSWLSRYQRLAGKDYYVRPEKPKRKLWIDLTDEEKEAYLQRRNT